MKARNALKLHKGDEVIEKNSGEILTVAGSPTVQHTYDLRKKKSEKYIIIPCLSGNTVCTYIHTEIK